MHTCLHACGTGPSRDLRSAGVLVHILDGNERDGREWLPCPPDKWCARFANRTTAPHLSTHLMHAAPSSRCALPSASTTVHASLYECACTNAFAPAMPTESPRRLSTADTVVSLAARVAAPVSSSDLRSPEYSARMSPTVVRWRRSAKTGPRRPHACRDAGQKGTRTKIEPDEPP